MSWNIRKQKNKTKTKTKKPNQNNKKKKKIQKPEGRISSLWDNFKRFSIRIIRVPEGQEKEQEIGNLFEKNNERKLP